MRRILLLTAGFLMLALGAVGIIIPVLPTTPFVLVAAACLGSASPKMYTWLAGTRYFGPFIENYKNKTGVPKSVKISALVFLWVMLLISMLIIRKLPIILILIVVGAGVTAHILMLKTAPKV